MSILTSQYVNSLQAGDVFREWLIDILWGRIENKECKVLVYKVNPASHTVCRFDFVGENYSIVAKFFSEPTGFQKSYDAKRAMENEFHALKKVGKIINVPKPIAIKKEFNCVLITEYHPGEPLTEFLLNEKDIYEKIASVSKILRKLHKNTLSGYDKEREFASFHNVLNYLNLDYEAREKFNYLLRLWWESDLLEQKKGCIIHTDAIPPHYLFNNGRVCALDFESSRKNANYIHDLGILCAEIKHFFTLEKKNAKRAKPYINHLLWCYSRNENEFNEIATTLPFFMSLGLLRISRLTCWSHLYKKYLIYKALKCLKAIK